MDVFIFGVSLVLLVIVGWIIIAQTNKYLKKQHNVFMGAFHRKFDDYIINKMKQLYATKEVLDEYYETHVRYTTYETIELYRSYEVDNIHQKLREQYYKIKDLEDYTLLNELDIELFAENLKQAESDLGWLKHNIVEQIESRFIRVSK